MARELRQRLVTAAIALPPVVGLVWTGGWPAVALFSASSLLATFEFLRLATGATRVGDGVTLAVAALLPWLPWAWPMTADRIALGLIAFTSFTAWASHVVRQDIERAAVEAPAKTQAIIFCALGLYFLASLRCRPEGRAWAMTVIAATFANDSAAFGFGKLLGRHRIAPRVSPGKSWEGAVFGAIGAGGAAALAAMVWPETVRGVDALAVALVCSALGPWGDFSKSLLKRSRGVKDAGRLLPGHGGMLDRVDALLVNAAAVWAWVELRA